MSLYNLRCNTCNKIIEGSNPDFKYIQRAEVQHLKFHPGHDTAIGVFYQDIKAWDYRQGAAIQSACLDYKVRMDNK